MNQEQVDFEDKKDKVFNIIKEIEEQRKLDHIVPVFAQLIVIKKKIGYFPRRELNALFTDNKIEVHRTLNDKSIHIKEITPSD